MACNSGITETMPLLYLPKWCLGLFLTMLPCVAVMWALTVLFGFLCVAHVQNFFNQGAQTAIAGANIICTLVGFVLSIICVRKKETRNAVNIISTIISALWLLLIVGFGVFALFLTFVK